jgi:hypothetical protein
MAGPIHDILACSSGPNWSLQAIARDASNEYVVGK